MEGIGKENHRRERREEGEGGDALDYSPRADTLRHCAPLSEHAISDAGISRTSDNYCPNGARRCARIGSPVFSTRASLIGGTPVRLTLREIVCLNLSFRRGFHSSSS